MNNETLLGTHALCKIEIEKLKKKLDNFLKEEIDESTCISERIKKLKYITNMLENVNIALDYKKTVKKVTAQSLAIQNDNYAHYLVPGGTKYSVQKIFTGSITYIKSIEDKLFYVWQTDNLYKPLLDKLSKMFDLPKFDEIPERGEIFGIEIEALIFRGMILGMENAYNLCIKLIDLGEEVVINKFETFYKIPSEYKEIIPQAILCKLVGKAPLPKNNYNEISNKLCLFDDYVFYMEKKNDEYFEVRIMSREIREDKRNSNRNVKQAVKEQVLVKESKEVKEANEEEEEEDDAKEEAIPLSALTTSIDEYDKESMNMSNEELEEFYDNKLSTTNAVKAVLGFQPHDDKNICRFYNPKTGGCFKGASCTLDHVARPINAITADVIPALTGPIDNNMPYIFEPNTVINITVTFIWELESFYAQINFDKQVREMFVWQDNEIPEYKLLKKPPLPYDFVLARYNDERWYRAKVIQSLCNEKMYTMYEVFYVDYGNRGIVPLKYMARCFESCAHKPFQAHLFHFANLRNIASIQQRMEGINMLREMLNKNFNVRVVSQNENIYVDFYDENVRKLLQYLLDNKVYEICEN